MDQCSLCITSYSKGCTLAARCGVGPLLLMCVVAGPRAMHLRTVKHYTMGVCCPFGFHACAGGVTRTCRIGASTRSEAGGPCAERSVALSVCFACVVCVCVCLCVLCLCLCLRAKRTCVG